jgi:hypothetical protein
LTAQPQVKNQLGVSGPGSKAGLVGLASDLLPMARVVKGGVELRSVLERVRPAVYAAMEALRPVAVPPPRRRAGGAGRGGGSNGYGRGG